VSATVELHPEDGTTLEFETEELYQWRKTRTPFNQPCCGSVFKNPALSVGHDPASPRTAGQFIEAAGLKGARIGAVEISPMHANYFVNTGGGTAAEVKQLMALARRKIADQFGVTLEPEVKLVTGEGSLE
jgi:UDP-N-acetylmuramate dehydrogenase